MRVNWILKRSKETDDEASGSRKKKTPVILSNPRAVLLGRNPSSQPQQKLPVKLDSLPRALFGEIFEENHLRVFGVFRINISEVERVTKQSLILDQKLIDKHILSRSEEEFGVIALNVLNKISEINSSSTNSLDLFDISDRVEFDLRLRWTSNEEKRITVLKHSICHSCEKRNEHRDLANQLLTTRRKLKQLQAETSDETLSLFPDLISRLDVLRELKYISRESDQEDEEVVELKGRVACEINTCDELLLTEMIFENIFDDPLTPAECAALLSCLVLQGKTDDEIQPPTDNLLDAVEKTLLIATSLQAIQTKNRVLLTAAGEGDWVKSVFNLGLLEVTYEWARGRTFATLTDLTSFEEGTIVKTIQRLEETCREVKNIARLIGNPKLLQKMELSSALIKRDIVFATSLYIG